MTDRDRGAIGNEIDRSDVIVHYRKAEHHADLACLHPHRSRLAVDKYRLRSTRSSRERPGNGVRAFDTGLQTIVLPVRRPTYRHHARIRAKRCSRIE